MAGIIHALRTIFPSIIHSGGGGGGGGYIKWNGPKNA